MWCVSIGAMHHAGGEPVRAVAWAESTVPVVDRLHNTEEVSNPGHPTQIGRHGMKGAFPPPVHSDAGEPAMADGEPSTHGERRNAVSDHPVPKQRHRSDERNNTNLMRPKTRMGNMSR